jgi:hypothetical protein
MYCALIIPALRPIFLHVGSCSAISLTRLGIERNMPSDLLYGRKWIFVQPDGIDGLLSCGGNAVVIAIAFVWAVGHVIRPFQLGKVNVLNGNVLNGRIRRFARQGVAGIGNHTARDGHDNPSGIALNSKSDDLDLVA